MVLDLDAQTMLPTNMHTYYIDVAEANKVGTPDWTELHDYLEAYEMKDLSPASFKDLALRMFADRELATYFRANEKRQTSHSHHHLGVD